MQTRSKKPPARSEKARELKKVGDPSQSAAFIEVAREIGADEDHSAADMLMERLARRLPDPKPAKKPKAKKPAK